MEALPKTIAKINDVDIIVIENGQKLVPIKPICEALGILPQGQIEKIKNDEILASTIQLSYTVGADGKEREMFCLPLKFVFGWLFTINPKNVRVEAQESVKKYKLLCYEILYQNFADHTTFLEQKQKATQEQIDRVNEVRSTFRNAQHIVRQETNRLNSLKSLTFEQWLANNRQMTFDFMREAEAPVAALAIAVKQK
ncbi:hypothetical protein AHMF7605_10520 [Adhaeribacter arboris]|uniref:Antirepressor protein ant N-terminal domain-containing protein n=1 Tax=Adhaeribacter arboris TaxID=2072846 RepID=A0A2T2YEH9_9BACT|nr:phage antirepressor N-terminal domain-containing protein [Adhaeribacter arboris]PSR53920.1 hypothetical protein AHMF7605_10520 [Adhaeribacter arboris]